MGNEFISSAIPYVNSSPHIGFALELLIADVIARFRRRSGQTVLLQTGTDEHSLKNVLAADSAGEATAVFVEKHARAFATLNGRLNISADQFLRTHTDVRHQPAVEALWQACAQNGDIYRADYEGLYCIGCEQFYQPEDLIGGVCAEHGVAPETVRENNYFFRLSRYQNELRERIRSDRLVIRPNARKNEILSFLDQPLRDLSISRSHARARGWGITVPGDEAQVVYVWFDALSSYISGCSFATDNDRFHRRWTNADRISHVAGKGVSRFHAVYWPAILLSAGLRLPDEILVHGYITIESRKISKSADNAISPDDVIDWLGLDAMRYFLLRHIGGVRDGDFSWRRLRECYVSELANDLGNLVSRTIALANRHDFCPSDRAGSQLSSGLESRVTEHIDNYEIQRALGAIWEVVNNANRFVNDHKPWQLAKSANHAQFECVMSELYATLFCIADLLEPFLPQTASQLNTSLLQRRCVRLFERDRASEMRHGTPAIRV